MASTHKMRRAWPLRVTAALVALAAIIPPLAVASAAPPDAASQAVAIERENNRLIAAMLGANDATDETRKLAERPDIQASFEAYQRVGGLAPKYRFARVFAVTSGFTGGPLAGLIDDAAPKKDVELLKAHPAAFDLLCEPHPAAASGNGRVDNKTKAAGDPDVPPPPTSLRFSVDVPAGLWRSGNAYIQSMHIGEHGKLMTKWRIDLEHVTWGAPVYDRISRRYDEVVTTTSLTSKTPSHTAVHATCVLAPYTKLFGAGG